MSPHCSAIFLQHSRSADVIAAPGNTQAATGSAASISARAETATLINSFNITSLSTADSKTQQAGKGFSLPPSLDSRGLRGAMLVAIFSHAADGSGLRAD